MHDKNNILIRQIDINLRGEFINQSEMERYANQLNKLVEDQEAEDADPDALIKGVKQAQDGHNKELEKIFTKEQLQQAMSLSKAGNTIQMLCLGLEYIKV